MAYIKKSADPINKTKNNWDQGEKKNIYPPYPHLHIQETIKSYGRNKEYTNKTP